MPIRDDYIAGELVTAADKNAENTALILLSKAPILVYSNSGDSTTLVNPVTGGLPYTLFDLYYDIPANDLIDGVSYSYKFVIDVVRAASTSVNCETRLSGNHMATASINPAGDAKIMYHGRIMSADAAAGASKKVRCDFGAQFGGGSGANKCSSDYNEVLCATNGILRLQWGFDFDTSNAGNNATLKMLQIWRHTKNGW